MMPLGFTHVPSVHSLNAFLTSLLATSSSHTTLVNNGKRQHTPKTGGSRLRVLVMDGRAWLNSVAGRLTS
jgi:hypothetical protein